MFVDFRTTDAATVIRCDICIIGGGAAGITLAQALIDSGIQVCLLESGGFEQSPDIQSLSDGKVAGLQNASPMACRLRYFGGTTNHWEGWCAPLHDIDFEPRSWIPNSGWPIRKGDLASYYKQAQEICQIGPFDFETDAKLDSAHDFPEFNPEKANIGFFRFSPPTRFGHAYRERLDKADNVTVFLYANTLTLDTNETASEVQTVNLQTLEGKTGSVKARIVVLACGGMENARLLLLSNKVQLTGLGNAHGLVGRFFMQHIEGIVARILSNDPEAIARNFKKYSQRGVDTRAEIALSERAQSKHRILNSGFTVNAHAERGSGYMELRKIWVELRKGQWPDDISDRLWTVLNDIKSVGDAIYKKDKFMVNLYIRAEPMPNAASRITLGNERDAFGQLKINVDWQLTQFDKHSIIQSIHRIAEEFGRLDMGRVELADWVMQANNKWPQPLWGGCHHMGTTRMSADEKTGVVDGNCRLHSVNNLYVAGSSVFPTAGYVPPTLTIVALALRLADHLKKLFHAG